MNCIPVHRHGLALLAVFTAVLAFLRPAACREAALQAFALCGQQLLPSLFPFLVVSELILSTNTTAQLGLFFRPAARILRFPPEAAGIMAIGFTGGFAPAGAAAGELYTQGILSARQTSLLLPACICSAPSFVILAVGCTMLGSEALGFFLFASQACACFFSALLLILFGGKETTSCAAHPSAPHPAVPSLSAAITHSTISFVKLCGFVIFFRFLGGGLAAALPPQLAVVPLLLLEVSSGCSAAASLGPDAAYWCCAVLSLQSVSVLMQLRALLPPQISFRPLLAARLIHLPLSLAFLHVFLLCAPARAVYSSMLPRVILKNRCPLDAAFWLLLACCWLASQFARALQERQKPI